MAADLLDKSIEERAAQAVVFAADEHPVSVPELGGANGVFDEFVVELNLASLQRPLLASFPLTRLSSYLAQCDLFKFLKNMIKAGPRCSATDGLN